MSYSVFAAHYPYQGGRGFLKLHHSVQRFSHAIVWGLLRVPPSAHAAPHGGPVTPESESLPEKLEGRSACNSWTAEHETTIYT